MIITQQPNNFTTNVILNIFIKIGFSTQLNRNTINPYTVFLVNTVTQESVDCVIDYIYGTQNITIQLFNFLEKNTNYTIILIGGSDGIKQITPAEPFSNQNYISSFTTGETIDWNIPLAKKDNVVVDAPAIIGIDGIYTTILGRTGEAVSHIVTTAGQIGPSGTIVPAPWGAEQYIPVSGIVPGIGDIFSLVSTIPTNEQINITATDILFRFNSDLASIGGVEINVTDILEQERIAENILTNYAVTMDSTDYTIAPSGTLTGFTDSAVYTVTLNNIVDILGNVIDSVSLTFNTKIFPFYSTVKLIRGLGQLIASETDDNIRLLIYQNSLWILENSAPTINVDDIPQAAKDFVTCKTKLDLIERRYLQGGQITRKTLADLTIEYGGVLTSIINKIIDNLSKCADRNSSLLGAGLNFIYPQSAIKAKDDPRMPISATSWVRLKSKDFI